LIYLENVKCFIADVEKKRTNKKECIGERILEMCDVVSVIV
jgi:hypothetical protein